MRHSAGRILYMTMLLAFFAVIIYAVVACVRNISVGAILIGIGILIMFGPPTIYFLLGVIASFCGHKVIAQVVSSQYFNGDAESHGGWQVGYAYTDLNGNLRFGTTNCGHRQPSKLLLVRCFGMFHYAQMVTEISQEEYNEYASSNIEMSEAEQKYKKHMKKFWITVPLMFAFSILLIIVGAILIS